MRIVAAEGECGTARIEKIVADRSLLVSRERMNVGVGDTEKDMSQTIQPGRYRHYKGKDYQVLGCARHTETEEEYVVYRALYGEGGLWVRPKAMFLESVVRTCEKIT